MPYLTLTENLKLQLSPGLVASYDIQPGNGDSLTQDEVDAPSINSFKNYLQRRHNREMDFFIGN